MFAAGSNSKSLREGITMPIPEFASRASSQPKSMPSPVHSVTNVSLDHRFLQVQVLIAGLGMILRDA